MATDKRTDDQFGAAIFSRLSRIGHDIEDVLATLDARVIEHDSPILTDAMRCSALLRHQIRGALCRATLCMDAALDRDLARRNAEASAKRAREA